MELSLEEQKRRQAILIECLRSKPVYTFQQLNNNVNIDGLQLPLVRRITTGLCCITKRGSACPPGWNVRELGTRGKVGVPYTMIRGGKRILVKVGDFKGTVVNYSDDVVELDEFTNETIIAYILNSLFDRENVPLLAVRHLDAVYCPSISAGYNVMELANGGNLQGLDVVFDHLRSDCSNIPKVVGIFHKVLSQLLVCLKFLQLRCEFTSGDLKAENVVIHHEPIDALYNLGDRHVRLEAKFRCLLVDFGKCSVTMTNIQTGKPYRIHSSNKLFDVFKRVTKESPIDTDVKSYELRGAMAVHLAQARHGSKRYYPSFDWYTLILSLLTLDSFRHIMFVDDEEGFLKRTWWYPLWQDKEQADRMEDKVMSFCISRVRTIMQPLSLIQDEPMYPNLDNMIEGAFPIVGV